MRHGARAQCAITVTALAAALAVGLGLWATSAWGSDRYGPADTGVVKVSNEPRASQGEEPLSFNPLNPRQLSTVANVFIPNVPAPLDKFFGSGGVQDSRVYSSQDGGRHWLTLKLDQGGIGALQTPLPPLAGFAPEFSDAFNILNTDSDSTWDRHGNAYFESGDIHGIHHNGNETATVWRSTDGGVSWGPPGGYAAVNATQEHNELDRPWLAIDNSGGPHDGRLYVTFETTPFANEPPQVYVKHSDDHGQSWSPTVRVDDGIYETQYNARARPIVGPDGTLYVVYDRAPATVTPFTPQVGTIQLALARSTDGGETFQRLEVDGDVHRVSSPDEATPNYTEMIPAIAADPGRPGRVAVAWPQATSADSSRVLVRYSTDGGLHWSDRIDAADDPAAKVNQHDHVTLAWYGDGRLFVGWRDRRCCGGSFTDNYQQWVRVLSPDPSGALVPGRTLQFSDGPERPGTSGRGSLQPDEFQGLVATSAGVGLTWSRFNGSLDDLMFRSVPLSAFEAPASGASGVRGGCIDTRRFVFHLHGLPGQRVVRAVAYVNGRPGRTLRGRRLRRLVLRALPQGLFRVRIVTYTNRGNRVISVRRYRGCAKTPPWTHVVHARRR